MRILFVTVLAGKSKEAAHHSKERPEFVHYDHLRRRTKVRVQDYLKASKIGIDAYS